jgi:hypothetical protein
MKKSKYVKLQGCRGQDIGPPRPFHVPGNISLRLFRTFLSYSVCVWCVGANHYIGWRRMVAILHGVGPRTVREYQASHIIWRASHKGKTYLSPCLAQTLCIKKKFLNTAYFSCLYYARNFSRWNRTLWTLCIVHCRRIIRNLACIVNRWIWIHVHKCHKIYKMFRADSSISWPVSLAPSMHTDRPA